MEQDNSDNNNTKEEDLELKLPPGFKYCSEVIFFPRVECCLRKFK